MTNDNDAISRLIALANHPSTDEGTRANAKKKLEELEQAVRAGENATSDDQLNSNGRRDGKHEGATIFDFRQLEKHRQNAQDPPTGDINERGMLKRTAIKTRENVFQPRTFEGQLGERHGLIQDLVDAINRGGVEDLGPIAIWWSGKEWLVVDGHHRLIAVDRINSYRWKTGKGKPIKEVPVRILEGSLSKALNEATTENGKTHLSLPARQRSNWAWRIGVLHWSKIIDEKFILSDRYRTLHVSRRTLTNMKAVWQKLKKKLEDDRGGKPLHPMKDRQLIMEYAEQEWRSVERMSRGGPEEDEAWDAEKRRKEARKTAEKLVKVFGKQMFSSSKAAIFADALVVVSERFAALALKGSEDFEEAIREALKDEIDFDFSDEDGENLEEDIRELEEY